MKKFALPLILIFILLLTSCAPQTVSSGGVVVRGDMPKPTDIESYYSGEDIVYVTKSGTKYHKENCSYLKSSKIPVSLEQAIMEGLTPCSRCFGDDGHNRN